MSGEFESPDGHILALLALAGVLLITLYGVHRWTEPPTVVLKPVVVMPYLPALASKFCSPSHPGQCVITEQRVTATAGTSATWSCLSQ